MECPRPPEPLLPVESIPEIILRPMADSLGQMFADVNLSLQEEAEILRDFLGLISDVEVHHVPDPSMPYHGESIYADDRYVILIYDEDLKEARRTLVHEIVELAVVETLQLTLMSKSEEELSEVAKNLKEGLVEGLSGLYTLARPFFILTRALFSLRGRTSSQPELRRPSSSSIETIL